MTPGSAIKAIKDNAASNQWAWLRFRSLLSLFARYAATAAAASDLFVGIINPAAVLVAVLSDSVCDSETRCYRQRLHLQNTDRYVGLLTVGLG